MMVCQAAGASQFFRDAWDGTEEANLPAECPYDGQTEGLCNLPSVGVKTIL